MRTGLPREIWAHVAVPLTTLKACSLSAGTSLYLATLPLAIHGACQYLASALGCGITATVLRARGILFCESDGVVYELTVTTGIDSDIVHELYELHCLWFFTGATDRYRSRSPCQTCPAL